MEQVNESNSLEKKEVLPERILANHARFMAALINEKPEAHLLKIIKRSYKLGSDLNLKFENFQDEFKTQKLKEALEWISKNPPKKRTKV
ncbi:hypothetical protein EHQ82_10950 [Leptospira selangorensis]|uniref:Uncharacterized protein n=1 Tax=Leptospira selangorensis TaxID=2484982 RepID=A0ABY2N9M8_9LEPT|nr:hypothetical protein [Leptospira selangorensis]TGM19063.1 hypothetical protein EHQ82_10950 [Leptospira selangorensis]